MKTTRLVQSLVSIFFLINMFIILIFEKNLNCKYIYFIESSFYFSLGLFVGTFLISKIIKIDLNKKK